MPIGFEDFPIDLYAGMPASAAVARPARESARNEAAQLAALLELIARMEATPGPKDACRVLAPEFQQYFSGDHVVVGLSRSETTACRVMAMSHRNNVDTRHEHTRLAQAVLQESIARGTISAWPAGESDSPAALLAHRQYAQAVGVESVVSIPLRDELGRVHGAWFLAGPLAATMQTEHLALIQASAKPLAACLNLLTRAKQNRVGKLAAEAWRLIRQRRGWVVLAALALACLAMLIPVPYQIKCDCTLEPVVRRFVAAPFDGPLEKTFVEPGEVVTKNQLLARMDGREIRWELSGARADLHRATKEHAGYVAAHDSGKAQIARHEMERLQRLTELLEHRDRNLEIRSPIDGLVVSGEWDDAVGMPLTVGKSLFEIAPLDEMVVEVAIRDDDVAFVRPNMPVHLRFDAFPFQRIDASVDRIHPRAELRDDENVFIAEVRLDGPHPAFRPGMRGQARIQGDRFSLGWNLFHRPAAGALAWLGW